MVAIDRLVRRAFASSKISSVGEDRRRSLRINNPADNNNNIVSVGGSHLGLLGGNIIRVPKSLPCPS